MRIRIVFSLKNKGTLVPFHYQYLIDETIRELISTGNNETFKNYDEYNFSSLKGRIQAGRGGISFFSELVTLVFSSSNKEFMNYFVEILFKRDSITIGDLILIPEKIVDEPPVIFDDAMKFLCISPIVLMPESYLDVKEFICPQTDKFSDLLYNSTIMRMEATEQYTADELDSFYKFQLVAEQDYIDRVEENNKKYSRIYSIHEDTSNFEVRGYTFPFTMYAPHPVQRFIYDNGIGCFCGKGFGMIDLASPRMDRLASQYNNNHVVVRKSLYA